MMDKETQRVLLNLAHGVLSDIEHSVFKDNIEDMLRIKKLYSEAKTLLKILLRVYDGILIETDKIFFNKLIADVSQFPSNVLNSDDIDHVLDIIGHLIASNVKHENHENHDQ